VKRAIDVPPFGELSDPRVLTELASAAEERGWRPRIPVWVGGEWPYRRPVERALRWDGYFPTGLPGPEALAEVTTGIRQARPTGAPFDVIVDLPPDEDTGPWERAGATWAVTDLGLQPSRSSVLAVINDGPR
jgi:hypothetical protein